MPVALQVVQEKNKEPTVYNVLDVVASCCQEWFHSMEATGTFVSLTSGRRFVHKTHTEIADQATMDEAVLHSLRKISSFHPAVNMQDLCSFISVAFSVVRS
ncbi:hypothetical protein RvY_11628 [Ramazzottius varieornatus]|uniref:Uncharacterized protein n=1 Tax=Ramazzottius varieornatus TaxID=947166 RepID=A0A1D1VPH4_RAMVA|nr:hypothetical protein RvY_11628 [Ramazzottius varieornatus]